MGHFDKVGYRVRYNRVGKIAVIAAGAILSVAATCDSIAPAAEAALTDKTPYYMCFAYTPDGMFFAGGDFDLRRAQRLVAANCNMPKAMTVVLLRTLMVRRNGRTYSYDVP